MKTLKSLVQEYQNTKFGSLFIVCICCGNDELSDRFLQQAEKEGFVFTDKTLQTENKAANVYYINTDYTIEIPVGPYALIKKLATKAQNMVLINYADLR